VLAGVTGATDPGALRPLTKVRALVDFLMQEPE